MEPESANVILIFVFEITVLSRVIEVSKSVFIIIQQGFHIQHLWGFIQ